jgi:hypothetical protein
MVNFQQARIANSLAGIEIPRDGKVQTERHVGRKKAQRSQKGYMKE